MFLRKAVLKTWEQTSRSTPMPKCDFSKVALHALQVPWNHTSAVVFSCKFAACFQNTFLWEQLYKVKVDFNCWGHIFTATKYGKMESNETLIEILPEFKFFFSISQKKFFLVTMRCKPFNALIWNFEHFEYK